MKLKRKYILLLTTLFLVVFGYGIYYYYAPPRERQPYSIAKRYDDTLRIAYIGDSWAFYHYLHDNKLSDSLTIKLNRPTRVTSIGYCGRSSKEIYYFFFNRPEMATFLSKGYDYCVISAGINDANKKMSTNYYKYSIDCIIRFMFANQITPILLEIPDYDIERVYRWETPSRKILRSISRLVTGTPINCKQEFRQALDNLMIEKGYADKVQIIRYKSWNNNYSEDIKIYYKGDGIHLNNKGYAKLDSCIAEKCIKLQNNRAYEIN